MKNTEFVRKVCLLCGLSYEVCDCKDVVRKPLGISFKGTNWLWRSIFNSSKYRFLKWRVASEPDESELEPGDVLFKIVWDKIPPGYHDCPNAHHVGVYIGNGEVVHSSPGVGVRRAPFVSSEWDGWGKMLQVQYIDSPRPADVEVTEHELTDSEMIRALYQKYI